GLERGWRVELGAGWTCGRQRFFNEAARVLKRPSDNVEIGGLSIVGILSRHDMATSVRRDECPHGRRDDSDALGIVRLQLVKRGEFAWHIGVVEEHSLFAERWFVFDPVEDV